MSDKASEFIALMTTVKELLNDAANHANTAAGTADEGAQLFAQGGNTTSYTAMEQAAESARKVFEQAVAATSIADEAIAHAQRAAGGLPAAPQATGPPSASARPAVDQPERPPFKPMRTDPPKRDEIAPYVGLDYAVATLWGPGGQILGPHEADDDGPAATAKWRPPWRDYPRLRRHVEAHAAARMRTGVPKQLAMYINLPPCSYDTGCKLNVADLIPRGSTLYVHQVLHNGSTRVHIFHGTGRALDD